MGLQEDNARALIRKLGTKAAAAILGVKASELAAFRSGEPLPVPIGSAREIYARDTELSLVAGGPRQLLATGPVIPQGSAYKVVLAADLKVVNAAGIATFALAMIPVEAEINHTTMGNYTHLTLSGQDETFEFYMDTGGDSGASDDLRPVVFARAIDHAATIRNMRARILVF